MPTLQVRDLPQDVYEQLQYLAEKDHRSLAQETIALLKEGIAINLSNKERRRKFLDNDNPLVIDGGNLSDPADFIREGRER